MDRNFGWIAGLVGAVAVTVTDRTLTQVNVQSPKQLREWWHEILRTHGKYQCYGVFLTLPTDTNVVNYLKKRGGELDLISRDKCLVLFFSDITGVSADRISDVDTEVFGYNC